MTTGRWAEISTLDGESVLLIMERTDPDERPDVLSETPIATIGPEQDSAYVDVSSELAALGYREVGQRVYTDYGCALGIAALRPSPGRPEVGRPINIRLGDELLDKVDRQARAAGITRAELIRRVVAAAMSD